MQTKTFKHTEEQRKKRREYGRKRREKKRLNKNWQELSEEMKEVISSITDDCIHRDDCQCGKYLKTIFGCTN